jgi:hypothetical protein
VSGRSPSGVGVLWNEFSSIGEHRARLLSEETRDRTEAFVRLLLECVAIQVPLDRDLQDLVAYFVTVPGRPSTKIAFAEFSDFGETAF